MSDLIDRQAAIDHIEEHLRFGDELYPLTETDKTLNHAFEIAASCVYNLPSAQPESKWIPVTERLPDLWDERYLVSLAWGGVGVMEYKSTGFHNYGSFSPVPIETVTAWMPLPKPYERSEHD